MWKSHKNLSHDKYSPMTKLYFGSSEAFTWLELDLGPVLAVHKPMVARILLSQLERISLPWYLISCNTWSYFSSSTLGKWSAAIPDPIFHPLPLINDHPDLLSVRIIQVSLAKIPFPWYFTLLIEPSPTSSPTWILDCKSPFFLCYIQNWAQFYTEVSFVLIKSVFTTLLSSSSSQRKTRYQLWAPVITFEGEGTETRKVPCYRSTCSWLPPSHLGAREELERKLGELDVVNAIGGPSLSLKCGCEEIARESLQQEPRTTQNSQLWRRTKTFFWHIGCHPQIYIFLPFLS